MFTSCSSDDNGTMEPDPGAKTTYDANVAPIIAGNCLTCHGSPLTNGAPIMLTNFDQVVASVNNNGLLNRINNTTSPMPPTGLMSSALRTTIQQWVDDGMPEN